MRDRCEILKHSLPCEVIFSSKFTMFLLSSRCFIKPAQSWRFTFQYFTVTGVPDPNKANVKQFTVCFHSLWIIK